MDFPIGVAFRWSGDGDEGLGGRVGFDETNVLQRHPGDRVGIRHTQPVEEVRLIVVEVGKFDRQLAESTVGPVTAPVHGGVVAVEKLGDGSPVRAGFRAGDAEVDATEDGLEGKTVGDRPGKVNLHPVIISHRVPVPLGPSDVHPHEGAGGIHRADDFRDVGRGGAQGEIAGRGGFDKTQFDTGRAGGRDIFVAETEFAVQRMVNRRVLGDFTHLNPSPDRGTGVVNSVSVEIREGFSRVIQIVAVGVDKRVAAGTVSIRGFGDGIVVAGVAVVDVGPNLGDGGVRPDDHFIA